MSAFEQGLPVQRIDENMHDYAIRCSMHGALVLADDLVAEGDGKYDFKMLKEFFKQEGRDYK